MADMQAFAMWFLSELPTFLMAEPMSYFIGFAMLLLVIRLVRELTSI